MESPFSFSYDAILSIAVLIDVIIGIVLLHLVYYKSYLGKKGENLAMKEDIEDLTQKVESVRQQFTAENEKLKSDLAHIVTKKDTFYLERKTAYINYHKAISSWKRNVLNTQLGVSLFERSVQLEQKLETNERNYQEANEALSNIYLMENDPQKIDSASSLFMTMLEYHHWVRNLGSAILRNKKLLESAVDAIQNEPGIIRKREVAQTFSDFYNIESITKENEEKVQEYQNNWKEKHEKLIALESKFRTIARSVIEGE